MKKPRTLVLTLRYVTPMETANVPEVLERLAGPEGQVELLNTDMVRGDVKSAIAKREEARAASPTIAKAKAKKTARPAQKAAAG